MKLELLNFSGYLDFLSQIHIMMEIISKLLQSWSKVL